MFCDLPDHLAWMFDDYEQLLLGGKPSRREM
jgi:hypothetical protein